MFAPELRRGKNSDGTRNRYLYAGEILWQKKVDPRPKLLEWLRDMKHYLPLWNWNGWRT
jgi:hypothetical protein